VAEKRALILLDEDLQRITQALEPYQGTTRTRANLVMDTNGNALAQVGEPKIPLETLGAFVAASTAATKPVGTILQSDEFITLTHAGKQASLQITVVAEGTVLVTVFDAATTVGVVVFYLKPLVAKLAAIVQEVSTRKGGVDLGAGFSDSSEEALDDVFGGMEDS
jgi:predicted regulator of Ras-like GTPase activity (Roadblock/LC7/MglB family)